MSNPLPTVPQVLKIRNSVERLKGIIARESFSVERIVLFGSVARCDFTATSDVDICIVIPNKLNPYDPETVKHTGPVIRFIQEIFRDAVKIDYTICTQAVFENGVGVFKNIREEGVILWQHIGVLPRRMKIRRGTTMPEKGFGLRFTSHSKPEKNI